MEKDLKMEVFASVDTVKPVEFHVYELHEQKIGKDRYGQKHRI